MHVVCLNNRLIATTYFLQKFLFYVSFSRKSLFKLFEWKHISICFKSQKIMFYSVTIPAYFSLNSSFQSNRIFDVIYRSNNWKFYHFCQRATRKTHSSFFYISIVFLDDIFWSMYLSNFVILADILWGTRGFVREFVSFHFKLYVFLLSTYCFLIYPYKISKIGNNYESNLKNIFLLCAVLQFFSFRSNW